MKTSTRVTKVVLPCSPSHELLLKNPSGMGERVVGTAAFQQPYATCILRPAGCNLVVSPRAILIGWFDANWINFKNCSTADSENVFHYPSAQQPLCGPWLKKISVSCGILWHWRLRKKCIFVRRGVDPLRMRLFNYFNCSVWEPSTNKFQTVLQSSFPFPKKKRITTTHPQGLSRLRFPWWG